MPKPGGRGGKRSKKGQKRHFTSEDEIKAQQEKEEKEKAWRKQRGIESDESEGEEEGASSRSEGATRQAAPGDLPPSSEEEDSSDDEPGKPKGVEHLIDIQNPNRTGARQSKKISELNEEGTTQLSRREREELAKQQAAARYRKLHVEGKTEEAQSDMARLALIRKQRAEAAMRREEEQKAKAAKEAQKKAANK